MASIFRATDLQTGRPVAIKVPHPEMESDPVLFDRFHREQEIGKALDHPGVMKVYDNEDRSQIYMVMEWVDGKLLRQILSSEKKTPSRARRQNRSGYCRRALLHPQPRRRAPGPQARKHHGRWRTTASS